MRNGAQESLRTTKSDQLRLEQAGAFSVFLRTSLWLAWACLVFALPGCGDNLTDQPPPVGADSVQTDGVQTDTAGDSNGVSDGATLDASDLGLEVQNDAQTDVAGDLPAPDGAVPDSAAEDVIGPFDVLDAGDSGVGDVADVSGPGDADGLPDAATDVTEVGDADAGDTDPIGDVDAPSGMDGANDVTASDDVSTDGTDGCLDGSACVGVPPACHIWGCLGGACVAVAKSDGAACEDGDACTAGDACLLAVCTSGLTKDCNDGNPCTDDGCDANGCVALANAVTCSDGNLCTIGDTCKGGQCSGGAPPVCEDGNACTDDDCAPGSGCTHAFNAAPCLLFDLCQTSPQCVSGECLSGGLTPCNDMNPCTNDLCDPQTGTCLYLPTTTPCDDADACTMGDVCKNSVCVPGVAKDCDDDNSCTGDGCVPASGICLHSPIVGACDDMSACTQGDACGDGACVPGAAVDCADSNLCTDDVCDPAVGCTHPNNSAPCSPGNACELAQCVGGQCVTTGVVGCDDGNPCTVDGCSPNEGCVFAPAPDGDVCAGATPCAGVRACSAGKCAAGAKTDCSDGNPCTDDLCFPLPGGGCFWLPNQTKCEDGDLCTGQDSCNNGKCNPGSTVLFLLTCYDANVCTDDACDPGAGCTHNANIATCDDGSACTQDETCQSGTCKGGTLSTCDDNNQCTLDTCEPATGACSWAPKSGPCDDGTLCTGGDSCVESACVGKQVVCDDANVCTDDSCDPQTGACSYSAAVGQVACDDANACTSDDTCIGAACVGTNQAGNVCADGNVCSADVCSPLDGSCSHVETTGPCDDGNPCSADDTCAALTCVAGSANSCDDGNPCTTDACDPAVGACSYLPALDGAACDDGIGCTPEGACDAGWCAPTVSKCTLLTDTFDCGSPNTWLVTTPANSSVTWAVDEAPILADSAAYGCTLNLNDGKNYCGKAIGNYCYVQPTASAKSPNVDATDLHGVPRLTFDTWFQLDGPLPGGTGFGDGKSDVPLVVLRDVLTLEVLDQFLLSKSTTACSGPCQSVWHPISVDVPKVAGHVFRIELSLAQTSNWGNQGKGWFIDNLAVTQEFGPEVCTDALDNDGNGQVDCADPVCAGQPGC